jgi:hypothetical protein
MRLLARILATGGLGCAASLALAANTPPLSEAWNIAPSGKATSSGELLFRVTPGNGGDPVEVTVSVSSGTSETGVASNIRRAFNTQLRADQFNVEPGEGANVLVTQGGETDFAVELLDSDVESVRVLVQSAGPVAPPTVPRQGTPANPPVTTPATPLGPGDAIPPPAASAPPANASEPATPPANSSPPDSSPPDSSPPNTSPPSGEAAGAPASAPPPR